MIYRINKDMTPVPVSNSGDKTITGGSLPVGFMTMFAGKEIPEGFMAAQGQSLSREEYPELFEIIGTTFGAADSEHFNLPDTREVAIVGAGTNSKSTADVYNVGQFKEHQFASHTHSQASHTHTGTAHTHTMSHTHTIASHSHGNYTKAYNWSGCNYIACICCDTLWCGTAYFSDPTSPSTASVGACLPNAVTLGVCSATATNSNTGAESGGTHGKRMGIYYIIKVEAGR